MLNLTADHICNHRIRQPQNSTCKVDYRLQGDIGSTFSVRLELVAEEARSGPRKAFDSQAAARLILDNLKSDIRPPSQKSDGIAQGRPHMQRPRRDFPDCNRGNRPVNQVLKVAHIGEDFLSRQVDGNTLPGFHCFHHAHNSTETVSMSHSLYSPAQKVPSAKKTHFLPARASYSPLCVAVR